MDEREVFNLKPLKWVALGLIIVTFFQTVLGLFDITNLYIIVTVQPIGWLVVVLGMRKIRKYSLFNRCYYLALCLIGISVLQLLVIHLLSTKWDNLIGIIYIVFFIVVLLLFFYYLLKSIRRIALQLEEKRLAKFANVIWILIMLNVFIMPSVALIFSSYEIVPAIYNLEIVAMIVVTYAFIYKAAKILDGREIPNILEQKEEVL